MTGKNVAFVGAICVIAGWLLASTVSPPVARVQTLRPARPTAAETVEISVPATEALQLRLRERRTTPENRRNPFVFVATERGVASRDMNAPRPMALATAQPAASEPQYVLSGIGISGDTRTAVLTTGADVHIVRVNDVIGGYTVTDISEAAVTLARDTERHVLRFPHSP